MPETYFEQARFNMIEQQIRPWDVLDQQVLDVMSRVSREDFVPERYRKLAFADVAIPIGHDQFMMHPVLEGRLLQALAIKKSDRVLEVGTGSAFLTACLGNLAASVVSVEIATEFIDSARGKLKHAGIRNFTVHAGDACDGWGEGSYDAIALTGSLDTLNEGWKKQLNVGGRLFVVLGNSPVMEAILITRMGEHDWTQESLFETDLPRLQQTRAAAKAFVF